MMRGPVKKQPCIDEQLFDLCNICNCKIHKKQFKMRPALGLYSLSAQYSPAWLEASW